MKTENKWLIKSVMKTSIFKILCLISLVVLASCGAAGYETYNVTKVWEWGHKFNGTTLAVETGDMDGDGVDEIIAGGVDMKLRIFKHIGNNNYTVIWDSGSTIKSMIGDIEIADMDSDRKKDIIIKSSDLDSYDFKIYLFKNNGQNNYTKFWDSDSFFKYFIENVAIGDTDGDDKNEIVAGCYDNKTYIFKKVDNNYALVWNTTSLGTNVFVAVGDLDGDGKDEISAIGDNIYVFENTGNSNYEVAWEGNLTLDRDSYNPMRIHAEDIEGDGKEEIIAYGMDIYGFKNTANNNYSLIWRTRQGMNHRDLKMADLDGDGKKEIVSGMFRLFIFKVDKESEYELIWESENKLDIESISIGDVNGDKRKEIIVGTGDGWWGNIYVFEVGNITKPEKVFLDIILSPIILNQSNITENQSITIISNIRCVDCVSGGNVKADFLIDDVFVASKEVFIQLNTDNPIHYTWIPTSGNHELTIELDSLPDEINYENNNVSKKVFVNPVKTDVSQLDTHWVFVIVFLVLLLLLVVYYKMRKSKGKSL